MNIQTLTLGPLATNCYLVRAEESRRAVIIDPAANSKRLLAALEEQGTATLGGNFADTRAF